MKAAQYVGNHSFKVAEGTVVAPKAGEVRLSVGFVGICGTDMHIYHGSMDKRVGPPSVIGHEMSGTVAEIGADVEGLSVGDRVVVRPLDYCGHCPACDAGHSHVCHNLKFMGVDSPGAFQNSWTVKARTIHKLPDNLTLKEGALIEPLSVACHDVARARLVAGEKTIILGGGPIGQLIGAVAKGVGAEVMISEPNASRRAFAEANGILTCDPVNENLIEKVMAWTNNKGADVVFEVAGVAASVEAMTEVASVRGRICVVAIHNKPYPVNMFKFFWRELEMVGARVYEAADFDFAIELAASGKVNLNHFITNVFKLDEIQDAFNNLANMPEGMKAVVDCE
ncbi:MAG: alcohol dehydrogenase catalytic domain-containing protein [Asticcacaulis sp.]